MSVKLEIRFSLSLKAGLVRKIELSSSRASELHLSSILPTLLNVTTFYSSNKFAKIGTLYIVYIRFSNFFYIKVYEKIILWYFY